MWLFTKGPSVSWAEIDPTKLIIDVREKNEFRQIKGYKTKNVPLSELDNFTTDETIYVLCASGTRSKMAVKQLRKRGIDAINIKGGLLTYGR